MPSGRSAPGCRSLRQFAKWGCGDAATLEVRIGIATGLVVVGDLVGQGEAQERGVVGETPNLAARLQALAPPGAVVVSENNVAAARRIVRRRGSRLLRAEGLCGADANVSGAR